MTYKFLDLTNRPLLTSKHEVISMIMIIERQCVILIISVKNQKLCTDGKSGPPEFDDFTPECDKTNQDMTFMPPMWLMFNPKYEDSNN